MGMTRGAITKLADRLSAEPADEVQRDVEPKLEHAAHG
jgi:hypothetical protein